MDIKRYIIVQAVLTKDNELIPVWDKQVKFQNTEMYGEIITLEGDYRHQRVVECILDLETKELSLGIELNYYPSATSYKVGDVILHEKKFKELQELTIADVVFEKFDITIDRGSKVDSWLKNEFKTTSFDDTVLYCIKCWKPTYVLSNGTKVGYEHQLYKKV